MIYLYIMKKRGRPNNTTKPINPVPINPIPSNPIPNKEIIRYNFIVNLD